MLNQYFGFHGLLLSIIFKQFKCAKLLPVLDSGGISKKGGKSYE